MPPVPPSSPMKAPRSISVEEEPSAAGSIRWTVCPPHVTVIPSLLATTRVTLSSSIQPRSHFENPLWSPVLLSIMSKVSEPVRPEEGLVIAV